MRRRQGRVWPRMAFLAAVATCMPVGTWHLSAGLAAQSPASSGIPNLSGTYTTYRPGGGRGRGSGEGVVSLNARAKAIIAAFDEGAGPKWDCVASALPRLVTEPYNFRIEQQADRVLLYYEKDDVVRTVWLDGHGHAKPKTGEYFLQGYSTGRYEGNQLVVETTKFVYDPHGITDNSPFIPSSQRKKVTERYSRDGTLLKVAVVTEDPLILTKPQEFIHQAEPTTAEWVPFECDISTSHELLKFLPQKYGHP